MNDLISRQAAIDAIREMSPELFSAYQHNTYVDKQAVMVRLMALPSVQPEREKGEWIRNDNGTYSCSVCQSWIPEEQHCYARYCLYCGAKMEEDNETN